MPDSRDLYQGREHSKIKHLFLAGYLKAASFKVLQPRSGPATFTYVDGFAGPWSVQDDADCSDASFDYAVRVLLDTQEALRSAGKPVPKLKFLLCEKDAGAFERLSAYAAKKVGLEVRVFRGLFEDNLEAIRSACAGFTFTFIDPKGWNLRSADIAEYLSSVRGDFLFNFMEHPISRHNSLPAVNQSFARLLDDPAWNDKIAHGPGASPREIQILDMLKDRLKSRQAAKYMPDFAILKPRADRVQMRLVLGTHHVQGVEVFRTVQKTVQGVQVETRQGLADGGQQGLFSALETTELYLAGEGVGGAKSLKIAKEICKEIMTPIFHGVHFDALAAQIMEKAAVRMTNVKDIVLELRSSGFLKFDLDPGAKKPSDRTLIWRTR
ncbi:hypothetical protein MASR1M32_12200 [Rhodobacter sp.]